jgi:hypothetical protein
MRDKKMKRRPEAYTPEVEALLDQASLLKHEAEIASARVEGDFSAEAQRLYARAASVEEEIAQRLMAGGEEVGAHISLVSAAHCYAQADQYADALRVCRQALRHPALPEKRRPQLEQLERRCLAELQPPSRPAPKPEPAEAVPVA